MSRARIALGALVLTAGLAACGGPASSPVGQVTLMAVPAVPTVAQVATALHATRVTDCGRAPLGGVVGSGTAYLGSERIGIDVFAGPSAGVAWERMRPARESSRSHKGRTGLPTEHSTSRGGMQLMAERSTGPPG